MADVDFGDTELFEQLDDSLPPVSTHIRFTEDDEDCDEIRQLRSRLEECEDYNQRLAEENILTVGSDWPQPELTTASYCCQNSKRTISKNCFQFLYSCL